MAFETIQALDAARQTNAKGLTQHQLAARLRVDDLQLVRPLQALRELDWIGNLDSDTDATQRIVLLVNPEATALMPLAYKLLLPHEAIDFWGKNGLSPAQNMRGSLLN